MTPEDHTDPGAPPGDEQPVDGAELVTAVLAAAFGALNDALSRRDGVPSRS